MSSSATFGYSSVGFFDCLVLLAPHSTGGILGPVYFLYCKCVHNTRCTWSLRLCFQALICCLSVLSDAQFQSQGRIRNARVGAAVHLLLNSLLVLIKERYYQNHVVKGHSNERWGSKRTFWSVPSGNHHKFFLCNNNAGPKTMFTQHRHLGAFLETNKSSQPI